MKKIISLIVVLTMLLVLVACGGSDENENGDTSQTSKVEKESTDDSQTSKDDSETSTDSSTDKDDESEKSDSDEMDKDDESKESIKIDKSLTGLELLENVQFDMPKSSISVTESLSADGSTSTVTTYNKDFSTRTETVSAEGGTSVMIYNADEGMTYMYTEGDEFGVLYSDDEEDMEEDIEVASDYTFADVYEDDDLTNMEAKIEELDGQEVLYIKTLTTSDGYDIEMHVWYSTEFSVMLKHEMYMDGKLLGSSEIIKIETDVNIDNALFNKPEGITFSEW